MQVKYGQRGANGQQKEKKKNRTKVQWKFFVDCRRTKQ